MDKGQKWLIAAIVILAIAAAVFYGVSGSINTINTNITETNNNVWFIAANGAVKVTIATDEILYQSGFENIYGFYDEETPADQRLIFSTNSRGIDLGYIAIHIEYDGEKEQFFIVERDVKCYQIITPNNPFVVNWTETGSGPHRGITFIDENNVQRYFAIAANPDKSSLVPVLLGEYPSLPSGAKGKINTPMDFGIFITAIIRSLLS